MDGGHYGSWGQVPLTIKGPSQWLGKNGSGKRREDGKGNCCRRTGKHKCCREKACRRGGAAEVEGKEEALQVERETDGVSVFFFPLHNMTARAPKQ